MPFDEKTKVILIENDEILVKLLQFSNAVIILITEKPVALGTICFATPSLNLEGMEYGESVALFGGRFDFFARALAERTAAETGKMVLVSVALNDKFLEDQQNLLKIMNAILENEVIQRYSTGDSEV